MGKHEIIAADIMPLGDYAKVRKERRHAITELKRNRRVAVGPDATFYFECYETMWHQIHEMLYIEKGGDDQIPGELAAYNPLIPGGRELVATLMFEVDDPARRARLLAALGGVEETVSLEFDGETVRTIAEADVERTNATGKASSVHFLHFPFTDDQVWKLAVSGTRVVLAIGHPDYAYMTVLPEAVRQALAGDFD
ncbi:MAG: DUF3501 family protein [Rhodospirillales bacterium]|jgi:hypothetical protein|nr:DUF3501 family protein [Rhodospirillales bacterium]HJO71972.1 DUF3501 family protein [Rhodospirillales bacterium]